MSETRKQTPDSLPHCPRCGHKLVFVSVVRMDTAVFNQVLQYLPPDWTGYQCSDSNCEIVYLDAIVINNLNGGRCNGNEQTQASETIYRPRATPLKVYVVITGQKLFCIKQDFDKAVQLSGYGGWVFQPESQQWESPDSKTVVIREYKVE